MASRHGSRRPSHVRRHGKHDRSHLNAATAAEVARLETAGFEVTRVDGRAVALLRKNSWRSHLVGAIFGGLLGGGLNPSPRTQRLWVHLLPDGGFETRLHEPR